MNKSKKQVRFSDVVNLITSRIPDPVGAGIERFVGLEHITPEDLHIHTWGLVENGITFTSHFKPGQVLFGKRRAYQRKVAIADFEGVCSGDIYVFESKDPSLLIPDLLPFICQSESFFDYSVKTSAGSLSPRTNWTNLSNYEFPLPALNVQYQFANLLWSIEKASFSYKKLICSAQLLLDSLVEQECWTNNKSIQKPLLSLVKNSTGVLLDGDWIETKDMSSNGVRLIQLADIGIGNFLNHSNRFISQETFSRLGCTSVFPNDILISRMADPTGRSCIIPELETPMITAVDCAILRLVPSDHILNYWNYVLNSKKWFAEVQKFTAGSTRSRISRKNLESILLPVPSKNEQELITEKLDAVTDVIIATKNNLKALFLLKKVVLDRMSEG